MSARLPKRWVGKPWGKKRLPPPFNAPPEDGAIGEIWFEPPPQLPDILVKYIFTSEKLSVQVHPSDAQTEAMALGRQGKEECWFILAADPGATIGVGFKSTIDSAALNPECVRAAALDGQIEDWLVWHHVQAGDFFYIPANTVHAIGAGISLIEVQQTSDITYRLYDYGRPRNLHLDDALSVAHLGPYAEKWHKKVRHAQSMTLVEGPYFCLDYVKGRPDDALYARYAGPILAIPLAGSLRIAEEVVHAGECAFTDCLQSVIFAETGSCLIAQTLATPGDLHNQDCTYSRVRDAT